MDKNIPSIADSEWDDKIRGVSHNQSKRDPVTYHCISCDMSFPMKSLCQKHMSEHMKNFSLKCRCCDKYFLHIKQFLEHLNEQEEKSLACLICSFKAKDKNEMKSHHQIQKIFYCCRLKEQKTSKEKPQLVKDNSSGRSFKTTNTLHKFIKQSKPILIDGRTTRLSIGKGYCCSDCGEFFSTTCRLTRHRKLHNCGQQLYACFYCPFRSDFTKGVKRHQKKIHKDLDIVYKCALCSFFTKRLSMITRHISVNRHRVS